MNLGSLTREQRLLGGAAACALFVISLFLPWFKVDSTNLGADDVVASWWLLLIFAIVSGAALAAEGLNVELPTQVRASALAAGLTSFLFLTTLMWFLDPPGVGGFSRGFGLFLALIFSLVAAALAVISWRKER
ncbi:MAG: hypothetical protein QOD86_1716 [Miltoncostaeaceae bacterium]|nr:hypothetical protein [Miltoncostaeaceae bacterium]